jgi:hypothetical protein
LRYRRLLHLHYTGNLTGSSILPWGFRRVWVFCGSNSGNQAKYRATAEGTGSRLVERGIKSGEDKNKRLTRFIREGAQSGLWGDEITPNIMAPGCFWLCDGAG